MTETVRYTCSRCGKEFDERWECHQHELDHDRCVCERLSGRVRRIYSGPYDFRHDRDGDSVVYDLYLGEIRVNGRVAVSMGHCPHCGRRLYGEQHKLTDEGARKVRDEYYGRMYRLSRPCVECAHVSDPDMTYRECTCKESMFYGTVRGDGRTDMRCLHWKRRGLE